MFEGVRNLFRKAGASVGMVGTLNKITDHKKINVDSKEYERIAKSRQYFEGNFDDVKYRNTYGKELTRPYMSINMMKVVVKRLASILYNEQAKIQVGTDDKFKEADEFIQSVFSENDFNKNFERYLESDLALGGLVIRPYYAPNEKKIKLAWCQAPTIYPLKNNTNDVSEIAISTVNQVVEGSKVVYYTLLEFHEWVDGAYQITNELYRSEDNNIVGNQVPLGYMDMYKDIEPVATIANLKRPLFVYMKPQGFNNRNIISPLGLGICDNSLTTLKQINDTFDQFNWEIQMGQRRVAVPEDLVSTRPDEQGKVPEQIFETNQNVFIKTPGDSEDGYKISDMTSEIRTEAYTGAINNALRMLELQIGLSAGTFSFDGNTGAVTATEVVSENSMTYQTRSSQLTMVERGIKELIISILELANAKKIELYTGDIPEMEDITVDFDDGVFTDKKQKLDYYTQALSAGVTSKVKAIEKIWGISEDQAEEMLTTIQEETSQSRPMNDQVPSFADGDEDTTSEIGFKSGK